MEDDEDQLITHNTGTIISHQGYLQKSPYPNEVDSILRIEVNGTLYVTLKVLDFELEEPQYSSCYDFIQVNDVTRYNCDESLSNGEMKSYFSLDGNFKLKFHTDHGIRKRGFRFQFNFIGL